MRTSEVSSSKLTSRGETGRSMLVKFPCIFARDAKIGSVVEINTITREEEKVEPVSIAMYCLVSSKGLCTERIVGCFRVRCFLAPALMICIIWSALFFGRSFF